MGKTACPEYKAWNAARLRCYSKTDVQYERYGKRGIRFSKRWKHSFDNFLKDMGKRPSKKHELDRIDNDGPYSKANCRWVTKSANLKNRRYPNSLPRGIIKRTDQGKRRPIYRGRVFTIKKIHYTKNCHSIKEAVKAYQALHKRVFGHENKHCQYDKRHRAMDLKLS